MSGAAADRRWWKDARSAFIYPASRGASDCGYGSDSLFFEANPVLARGVISSGRGAGCYAKAYAGFLPLTRQKTEYGDTTAGAVPLSYCGADSD